MNEVAELTRSECEFRLRSGVLGRLAVSTPSGPHIAAVPYVVTDDALVVRTTPYSMVGSHGRGTLVAFEVDDLSPTNQPGWGVVLRGRAEPVTDPVELARLTTLDDDVSGGVRRTHLRILLSTAEITGSTFGLSQPAWTLASAPPA